MRTNFVLYRPKYTSQRTPCLMDLNAENATLLTKVGAKLCFYHFVTFSRKILFFPEDPFKPELLGTSAEVELTDKNK